MEGSNSLRTQLRTDLSTVVVATAHHLPVTTHSHISGSMLRSVEDERAKALDRDEVSMPIVARKRNISFQVNHDQWLILGGTSFVASSGRVG